MSVEAIAPLGAVIEPQLLVEPTRTEAPTSAFGTWFTNELAAVNDRLVGTDNQVQGLAVGETQNLHQIMINMEEAQLSFQLMVQVRNHLLEAYQEVMRMQV